jgi:prepilin-type N-terminal cleavage/methylation domain-containing protein
MPRVRAVRAFTLIEAMIVVLIVGIIALLATVGYRKWVLGAHVAEANDMLASIRTAEESFLAENGSYINVSKALEPPNMYPQPSPVGTITTQWGGPCNSCTGSWTNINVAPNAPVLFGYAVIAGPAGGGTLPAISWNGQPVSLTALQAQPWYVAEAYCDLDGQGTPDTQIYALSSTNQFMVNNEGQ